MTLIRISDMGRITWGSTHVCLLAIHVIRDLFVLGSQLVIPFYFAAMHVLMAVVALLE